MRFQQVNNSVSRCTKIGFLIFVLSLSLFAQGKNPVILIPGLSGSELKHKITNDRIWFKTIRSKSEDLRLPIVSDPTKTGDDLIATDVLREVKIGPFPVTDVYGGFIKAMETRGGYHEETWNAPSADGDHDSLYVFAYDWRLDNVGNARILVRKIEALKKTLKKPNLKFDIVAHSMGGLISRYAAMYGDIDLPTGNRKPVVTWAGAKLFDKIILMGTPNEGSVLSLSNLISGFSLGGLRLDLPFVQDTSKFTVFTIPAAYQLLPAPGTIRAFDDKLEPITVDIYDPKVWAKYGWNAINDKKFSSQYTAAERKAAPAYFAAVLERARRLYQALGAAPGKTGGVMFYLLGADCKMATDAMVIYRDKKSGNWKTLFRPEGFTKEDGSKITSDQLKPLLQAPGDGVVTQRSLQAVTLSEKAGVPSIVGSTTDKFICGDHNKLATESKIQDYIIGVLNGKGTTEKVEEK